MHFKSLAVFAARLLKCVGPSQGVLHEEFKIKLDGTDNTRKAKINYLKFSENLS